MTMAMAMTMTMAMNLITEKKYDKASISILDRGKIIGLLKIMFGVGESRGKVNLKPSVEICDHHDPIKSGKISAYRNVWSGQHIRDRSPIS